MFIKKMITSKRSLIVNIVMLLLPAAFTIIALAIAQQSVALQDSPARALSLASYIDNNVPVSGQDTGLCIRER
jgi:hypothetical protein